MQGGDGIGGVAGAQLGFDGGGDDPPSLADAARGGKPLFERRHAIALLQRIAGGNQQPDLIKPQSPQCGAGDMGMAGMGRIETAAEQADPEPPPAAIAGQRIGTKPALQGRTCP